jgi:uncharacterized protein
MWTSSVGGGAGRMLLKLVEVDPEAMTQSVLAAHLRMEPTGGTFRTYLSRLRSNGLVEASGNKVKAADILWRGDSP